MDDLLARVRQYAQRYRLFSPGETVVVGVSGGPDSLCLLHLLRRLAPELRLWLHVADLHHGLRGAEADADAAFVAELADCWGLPCTVGRADVAALAREAGLSLEEAARQARYRFLARGRRGRRRGHPCGRSQCRRPGRDRPDALSARQRRGRAARHAPRTPLDKSWEPPPVSGTDGDAGDPPPSPGPRVPASPRLHVVRPLLAISRADIEAYCADYRLAPRTDRSNEDTTFFRNRLRHELLPILETYNPGIRHVLAHTAEVLAGDHEVLRREVEAAWTSLVSVEGPEEVRFSLAGLARNAARPTARHPPRGDPSAAAQRAQHQLGARRAGGLAGARGPHRAGGDARRRT